MQVKMRWHITCALYILMTVSATITTHAALQRVARPALRSWMNKRTVRESLSFSQQGALVQGQLGRSFSSQPNSSDASASSGLVDYLAFWSMVGGGTGGVIGGGLGALWGVGKTAYMADNALEFVVTLPFNEVIGIPFGAFVGGCWGIVGGGTFGLGTIPLLCMYKAYQNRTKRKPAKERSTQTFKPEAAPTAPRPFQTKDKKTAQSSLHTKSEGQYHKHISMLSSNQR